MVPQVDGLLEATYGRVDQLEDRYLGMVEAASSNLVSSTIWFIIILQMVAVGNKINQNSTFVAVMSTI
jgi:hypothetical protein